MAVGDARRQSVGNALREGADAGIFRRAGPLKGQRHIGVGCVKIEGGEMGGDGVGQRGGIDDLIHLKVRLEHLQVAARQDLARRRDAACIAAELHAVFRSAQSGGADAFAGRQQRCIEGAGLGPLAQRRAKAPAKIGKVAAFAFIDIFGDAA